MKLIIAGSRTITDYNILKDAIAEFIAVDKIYNISEVVSGTANGVDKLGEQWAIENHIPIKRMAADWKQFGRAAGMIRNKEMGDYADMGFVLWDGRSKGSLMMYKYMKKLNKPVAIKIVGEKDEII